MSNDGLSMCNCSKPPTSSERGDSAASTLGSTPARLMSPSVGAAAMLPFIKSGKVRCIATGSTQRLPQLPDVATVAEQGFPGFEMTQWYGMLAPASLPKEHLDKLAAETMKAVKAPEALKRLNGDAAEAIGGTPAQFAQFIAAEQARWQKVIKRAQIKPD